MTARKGSRTLGRFALLAGAAGVALHAGAAPVVQPARAVSFRPEVRAWAQVANVAPLELRMPRPATILRIDASPGQVIDAGTRLAQLGGARLTGEIAKSRAQLLAARQALAAARRSEAAVERNYPALADRRSLEAARSDLAVAEGRMATTEAASRALEAQTAMASPVAAVVATVHAAAGSDLPAGAPVVTLQPRGRLWLRAEMFGPMPPPASEARFVSPDHPAVALRLVDELPARAANGARVLNFAPVDPEPGWQAGEAGEVVVTEPSQSAVAVPAAALILDAGNWYVLADRQGTLAAQRVVPGPTQGDEVVVLQGLAPGTPVVVRQAYALYHRDVASRYTPPD